MSTQNEQPTHDQSADEELSESLAGHAALPETGDPTDEKLSESLAGHAGLPEGGEPMIDEPLEEIDGSPVRTENS
jgi:hypothetical protein